MNSVASLPRRCVARRYTAVLLALAGALGGCFQSYVAKPLQREEAEAAFLRRGPEDPGLRAFMAGHGAPERPWPPTEWTLRELTLLAIFYRPDVDVAQAQARVSRAAMVTAGQRPNPAVIPLVEHHSQPLTSGRPWTLGFAIDIPITVAGKREASIEQAQALAAAADLDVAAAVWAVRSRLRSRLMDYLAARRELALAEGESALRAAALRLLEQRLALGAASAVDVATERLRLLAAQSAAVQLRTRAAEARSALADALGLPVAAMDRISVLDAELDGLAPIDDTVGLRKAALQNRLDIQRGLFTYEATEAALKLEVARQYPDFSVGPGLKWDQGDFVWLIAAKLLVPVLNRNEGPILEAEARRELEAERFKAVQTAALSQVDVAVARTANARRELDSAAGLERAAEERRGRIDRRFALGAADRLDTLTSQLEILIARRARVNALLGVQRAQGALEDALQRPLDELPALSKGDVQPDAARSHLTNNLKDDAK
jgi:outer membrane protein TolC